MPIYSCLIFSGDDREAFLQGQLTQDVSELAQSLSVPAAWCSPKGRVIVTGRLLALEGATGLVLPADSVESVLPRLLMYRLRAKVDVAVSEDILSLALPTNQLPDDAPAMLATVPLADDTIEVHGHRDALERAGVRLQDALAESDWKSARIRAGLVDIGPANAERYTPHMLNLDKTGAISFAKGCYTGQEVVARTEHLGRVKRRLRLFTHNADAVAPGDRLISGENDAGTVVNASDHELLAVASADAASASLSVNGGTATQTPLPYSLD